MDALETLLAVQERDMAMDRLGVRRAGLPERAELASTEAKLDDLAAREGTFGAERAELAKRQETLDAEVGATDERITQIERRMYGGEVSASRELQAMSDEVQSLHRRKGQLEDREVDAMEALEPVDQRLASLASERESLEADAERLRASIAEAEREIDADLGIESAARSELAAAVPEDLSRRYERLRERLGGVGAARLAHNTCGGCHLSLPSAELAAIRRAPPDAVLTCEQCGRILVR